MFVGWGISRFIIYPTRQHAILFVQYSLTWFRLAYLSFSPVALLHLASGCTILVVAAHGLPHLVEQQVALRNCAVV